MYCGLWIYWQRNVYGVFVLFFNHPVGGSIIKKTECFCIIINFYFTFNVGIAELI